MERTHYTVLEDEAVVELHLVGQWQIDRQPAVSAEELESAPSLTLADYGDF